MQRTSISSTGMARAAPRRSVNPTLPSRSRRLTWASCQRLLPSRRNRTCSPAHSPRIVRPNGRSSVVAVGPRFMGGDFRKREAGTRHVLGGRYYQEPRLTSWKSWADWPLTSLTWIVRVAEPDAKQEGLDALAVAGCW